MLRGKKENDHLRLQIRGPVHFGQN
jgi:hypothetical protein